MNTNVSIPLLDTWCEKRSRERSAAGVGVLPREGGVLTVRGPHSTDNVTFFNPRFTLFAPPSAARKAQTVKVRLLSLYRAPEFATWKRRRDKDDVSLAQKRRRGREHREKKVEAPRSILRAREFPVRVAREGKRIEKKEEEEERKRGESSNGRNERRKEDMSAVESALDVLSRAATMMQGQVTPFAILFYFFFYLLRLISLIVYNTIVIPR